MSTSSTGPRRVPVYSDFVANLEEIEEARQTFVEELEEQDVESFMAKYHLHD
jgi:hypothetical protein